jgi:hypothetical protein
MLNKICRISLFCATLLIITFSIYSQSTPLLKWGHVEGASAYFIEIRDKTEKIVFSKKVYATYQNVMFLAPGNYEFRVAAMNKYNQMGKKSRWAKIKIEKALVPSFDSSSSVAVSSTDKSAPVSIKGSGFSEKTEFFLVKGDSKVKLKSEYVSYNEALVYPDLPDNAEGSYKLIAVNPNGFQSAGSFELVVDKSKVLPELDELSPEKVETGSKTAYKIVIKGNNITANTKFTVSSSSYNQNISPVRTTGNSAEIILPAELPVGKYSVSAVNSDGGRSLKQLKFVVSDISVKEDPIVYITVYPLYNLILGGWKDYFENSYMSFGAAVSFPLARLFSKDSFMGKLSAEFEGDYVKYTAKNVSNIVDRKMYNMSAGGGLGYLLYQNDLSQSARFQMIPRITTGFVYTSLETKVLSRKRVTNSIDPYLSLSYSFRFLFAERFIVELVPEYKNYFYKTEMLKDVRASLRLGYVF